MKNEYLNFFKTKDFNIATVLYSESCKLDSTEWLKGEMWFVFEDESMCKEIERKFLRGELKINPQTILGSQKTLKNLIFNK